MSLTVCAHLLQPSSRPRSSKPRQVWDPFNGDCRKILLLLNVSTAESKMAFPHTGLLCFYTLLRVPQPSCTISRLFSDSMCVFLCLLQQGSCNFSNSSCLILPTPARECVHSNISGGLVGCGPAFCVAFWLA